MPIDSTAQLLFNIGANSDDAEENIHRFRALLGTDLEEMGSQFSDWSEELVGKIDTVGAAMTAGLAVVGAGAVALGGLLLEETHKYEEFAERIEQGVRVTGLSAENMSRLAFAAQVTGTNFESLTKGLTFFESSVVKANAGSSAQVAAFHALGISTEQLKAGEKDIMPLLEQVMDRFQGLSSGTEKAAIARELFSRGGAQLQEMLKLGSAGLREMAAEAERLGLVLTGEDLAALKEHKAAIEELRSESEAWAVEIGKRVLPVLTAFTTGLIGLVEAVKAGAASDGFEAFIGRWAIETQAAQERMERLVKTMESVGNKTLNTGEQAAAAAEKFYGFTDMLDQVRQRTAALAGEDEKLIAEMSHLQLEITKTGEHLQELKKAGKIDPASANRELAAFVEANAEIGRLAVALHAQAAEKAGEIQQQFADDIARRLAATGEKSFETQVAAWDQEIQGLRDHLAKEKTLEVGAKAELLAQLNALQAAGDTKIWREQTDVVTQASEDLERRIEAQGEKSYTQQVTSANREIDALRDNYAKKAALTQVNEDLIARLRKVTIDKIDADQSAAYAREMSGLQTHLASMLNSEATRVEKLQDAYQKDLRAFSDAEQAKVLLTAGDNAKRAAIETEFAALRTALLHKYQMDLQGLANSQGWQAVFGSKFAAGLKNNEALEKQWATSSNQSLLMVRVSLENLKEMGQQAFEKMSEGMGAGIANALVYSKSVGAAMEAVLKSTLESIAAQAFTQAIYATALGFMDIAQYNYAGAAAAFEAAAMFAAVGAAAGIAGRAIPSGGGGAGASGSGSGGSGSGGSDKGAAGFTASPTPNAGPHVVVNIAGHVIGTSGIQQLTQMINEAVLNRDVTLTATNTKSSQVVNQ